LALRDEWILAHVNQGGWWHGAAWLGPKAAEKHKGSQKKMPTEDGVNDNREGGSRGDVEMGTVR